VIHNQRKDTAISNDLGCLREELVLVTQVFQNQSDTGSVKRRTFDPAEVGQGGPQYRTFRSGAVQKERVEITSNGKRACRMNRGH
jgi:hypothetical protein